MNRLPIGQGGIKSLTQNSGAGRMTTTRVAIAAPAVIRVMQRSFWVMLLLIHVLWMPAANAATYSGGSGTSASPYLISTSANLLTLSATSADWAKYFSMTANIDMTGISTFTPIGNTSTRFSGVFDGGGHLVRNVTIDLPTQSYVGLFGRMKGPSACIKNLGIENGTVSADTFVGAVVGENDEGTVRSCFATGTVTGGSSYAGGLVGHNTGSVISCYATNVVNATTSIAGGLVGLSSGEIIACYATGPVACPRYSGRLVGYFDFTSRVSFWNADTPGQPGSGGGKGLTTAQMKTLSVFQNAGWGTYGWTMIDGQYPRLAWEGTGAPNIPGPDPVPLVGSGTEADPYIVGTPQEFALLSWRPEMLNAHMRLTASLDCAGVSLHPIGDLGAFSGTFDGGNHYIKNATIEQEGCSCVGLFASLKLNGAIHNLGLDNIAVSGDKFVGALVGRNQGAPITSCHAEGTVVGTGESVVGTSDSDIGGLVGFNDSGGSLTDCYAKGAVTSTGMGIPSVGGLIGQNYGTVTNCYADCDVTGGGQSVGGLVGGNGGTIASCYATGSVKGTYTLSNVGGLVGSNYSVAPLTKSYATGPVQGSSYVGGLAGCSGGDVTWCYATGAVTCSGDYAGGLLGFDSGILSSCYSTGSVNGTTYVGGLVGQASDVVVTNCYATGSVVGTANLGGLVGSVASGGTVAASFWDRETGGPDNGLGIGLPTAQMRQRTTFETAGWDFAGLPPTWAIVEGQMYPYLFGIPTPIESVGALYALATTGTGTFFLTHDLDARDTANWTAKSTQPGFLPIGTSLRPFNGTLDGNGHRIYGLHIYRPAMDQVGLFGYIGASGVVRGVGLEDVDITGRNQTGGLAGVNLGTVEQSYVRGAVTGVNSVGGLLGENGGVVRESYAAAALEGNSLGGLIASDNVGTVSTSFWDTAVSGVSLSGGGLGQTSSAMQSSTTFVNAGWDFSRTWTIAEGLSYPYFQNSLLLRVISPPPQLINADSVAIVFQTFVPGLFVTVGGGAYPAYRKVLTAGQSSIKVSLKQEAINQLIVSAVSETGVETLIAQYEVYESAQFPSTPTTVTSLALRPASVSLATNATQQFTCTATFADGTTADVTPTANWNVSGGTITSTGLYTQSTGPGTVQALLHTGQGWVSSGVATVTTGKAGPEAKSGTGLVSGVIRSNYTGLGLPSGRVTAYNLFNPTAAGQYAVYDSLGNYAFFMPENAYHFEGTCTGHRSEIMWGGRFLESRELIDPGPPPQYSEPYYSGQVKNGRSLTHDYSLSPNDTGAPWVVFIEPVANTTVNAQNIVVTAIDADQYSELAVAKYTHNTVDYVIPNKISSTGFYRDTWALKLGLNVLHLYTMDTAGNASQKTIQITYDPAYTTPGGDTDGDGMPNAWETAHGLSPSSAVGVNGADGDLDGDGLTNLEEYRRGTLPNSTRSDSDSLEDGFEVALGTNPLLADTDGDGVNDDVEWARGSDPQHDDRIKMTVANLADGAAVRGDAVTLLADALLGYNLGAVASVSFEVRGTGTGGAWRVVGTASSAPFAVTWDTTALPEGVYEVRAVATSRLGCVDGSPATRSVTTASTAPYFERIEAGQHILSAPVASATDTVLALRAGTRFARITIPAGALAADDTLTAFFPNAAGFTPVLSTFQRDAGLYLDVHLATHTGDFLNGKRAALELGYPDADRDDHLDDTDLRVPMLSIRYLPSPTGSFVALSSPGLDRLSGCVTGETPHFSVFGVIEEQPAPPLNLLTDALPQGTVGVAYAVALDANGGVPPYTWTVTNGALPDGLSIVGGNLQGTPTAAGAFAFTLQVSDAQSTPYTASQSYAVNIFAANQPTVTVTRATGQTGLVNALPARWDIVFSEPVTGFETGDVTLTGTASYGAVFAVTGSGAAYTLTVSNLTHDGTLHPAVLAGSAASIATSALSCASANEEEIWVDRRKPEVSITCSAAGSQEFGDTGPMVVKTLPILFTLTFSEPVTGLSAAGITFAGLSPQPTFQLLGAGKEYTILVIDAAANTTLAPSVNANAAVDSTGNGVLATTYTGRVVQYTPEIRRTVTLNQAASQADPVRAFPILYDIVFSAPVTGFGTSGVTCAGTAPNPQYSVTGTGAVYTLTVTGASGDGRIAFRIPENVVNEGNASSTSADNVVTYDTTPPGIVIGSPSTAKTRQGPVSFSVQYAGASTVTLSASDILLNGTPTAQVSVTGTGNQSRVVTLSGISGLGALGIGILAGTATDAAGNAALAAGPSATFQVAPLTSTVNEAAGQVDPTKTLPIRFDVVFADAVTGFDASDVTMSGTATGVVFAVSGSGSTYTINVTAVAGDGSVSPTLAAGVCLGADGSPNEASTCTDNTVSLDRQAPTCTVTGPVSPTKNSPVNFTITFSEPVMGLTVAGIAVTGGAPGTLTGSGAGPYTLPVTPSGQGAVTCRVASGAARDAATNGNTISNLLSIAYDSLAPTCTVTGPSSPTRNSPIAFTINFSEPVTGLTVDGIAVTGGAKGTLTGTGYGPYTLPVTPTGQGPVTCQVPAGAASDTAANGNTISNLLSVTYDSVAPTCAVTSTSPTPTNVQPIPFRLTFSEPVMDLLQGEVTVVNGGIASFAPQGSGPYYTVYDLTVTPSASGSSVSVSATAGVAHDAAGNGNAASNTQSIVFDGTAPTCNVTGPSSPTKNSPVIFTINFSKSVTGLTVDEIVVAGGVKGSLTGSGAGPYTLLVTPAGQGDVACQVPAGAAQDPASNDNETSNLLTIRYDSIAPDCSVLAPASPTHISPLVFTLIFTEPVTGLATGGITVTNGAKGTLAGSGNSYTLPVTPSGQGPVACRVGAGAAQDAAGNGSTVSNEASATYDSVVPTCTVTGPSSPTNLNPITFTLTFSEPVSGLAADGVGVGNGTKGALSGSGTTYTIPVTPSGNGPVTCQVGAGAAQDAAGNVNSVSNNLTVTYDTRPPSCAVTGPASPTNGTPIVVTITFDELVAGLTVDGITVANATKGTLTGSGSAYSLPLTPFGQGPVTCRVSASAAHDAATNGNTVSNDLSITYDSVAPTCTVTGPATPTNASPIPFTINFSEPVSGLTVAGIAVTGGTPGTLTGSGLGPYTLPVTPSGQGPVTCQVAAGAAQDQATNGNAISNLLSITHDSEAPTCIVTGPASPTNVSPLVFTLTFSDAVTGLLMDEIRVTGGAANGLTGSGTTYTLTVIPAGVGEVTCQVPAGAAQDQAGNGNAASNELTIAYNNVRPTCVVSAPAAAFNYSPITFTIVFSVPVTDMTADAIMVTNGTKGVFTPLNDTTYTIDATPSTQGAVTCTVADSAAQDASHNWSTQSNTLRIDYDVTAPTCTVTAAASPTNANPLTFTITFNENVTGLEGAKLNLTNATNPILAGSGSSYTVTVWPSNNGAVAVQVQANATQDLAGNNSTLSNTATVTYDQTLPTCSVTAASPTNAVPIVFTIAFDEAVVELSADEIVVTGGTKGGLTGFGAVYSLEVTAGGQGNVTCRVPAGAASDAAGNGNQVSNVKIVTYDSVNPMCLVTPPASPAGISPMVFTLTFDEPVSGLLASRIQVTNGTKGALNTADNQLFTLPVTPSGQGPVTCQVPANTARDAAGNGNGASNEASAVFDSVSAACVVTGPVSPAKTAPLVFTLTFGEPVSGLLASEVQLTNGTPGALHTVDNQVYALEAYPLDQGAVKCQVPMGAAEDAAGNGNTASGEASVVFDSVAPTCVVTAPGGPIHTPPVVFTILFSEPVYDLTAGNISIGNGMAGTLAGSGVGPYTFEVTPLASGDVTCEVLAGAVSDAAGNGNDASGSASVYYDDPSPACWITGPSSPTNDSPILLNIQFGAPVTGLDIGKIVVTNGTKVSLTGSLMSYSLTVTPGGQGAVTCQVPAGAAQDAGAHGNTTSNLFEIVYDTVAPTAILALDSPSPTTDAVLAFSVDFSESVGSTLTQGQVSLNGTLATGASVTRVTQSGKEYTVTVTVLDANADGTLGITVGPGVMDLAGNAYAGASSPLYTVRNWFGFHNQPRGARKYLGDNAVFTVAPNNHGSSVPTYQWWFDDLGKAAAAPIDGATSSSLTVGPLTLGSAGDYWCVLWYMGMPESSNKATLDVEAHLQITAEPVGSNVQAGNNYTFTVVAAGGYPPLSYLWKKNGNAILTAPDAPEFMIAKLEESDTGRYSVEVSDDNVETRVSGEAELTVQAVGLPVLGVDGLVALASFMALAGLLTTRRARMPASSKYHRTQG